MSERPHADAVEAALESARRAAGETSLPPALRARILAAARPGAPATEPRGRLLDFVLRAVAVAAAFAAVLLVMPLELEAAEFGAQPILDFNDELASSIADRLPPLDLDAARLPEIAGDAALPLAGIAVALVACGLVFLRRERGR